MALNSIRVVVACLAALTLLVCPLRAAQSGPAGDGSFESAQRLGAGLVAPTVVKSVNAVYTREAREKQIQGVVVLEVVIKADGAVGDLRVQKSLDTMYGLDESAKTAGRQWRFTPARDKEGRAVPVVVSLEMSFRLE